MTMYRIKTVLGYYFADPHGINGYMDGDEQQAWPVCEHHRDRLLSFFRSVDAPVSAEEVDADDCMACESIAAYNAA